MLFARVNGVVLHHRIAGAQNKPWLVLANSLGSDGRIWDGVIDRLQNRFRILSYDKRGHGLSAAPPGPYSLADHAADLLALIDHLQIKRFALAGISVGGQIAQSVAAHHGERLSAAILCATAPRIGTPEGWNSRIEAIASGGLVALGPSLVDRWFSPSFRAKYPDRVEGYRAMIERTPVAGYVGTCATVRDADLRGAINRITVPTLVVSGLDDVATTPEMMSEMAHRIPYAQLEVLGPCGHIPSLEQPESLSRLIGDFLEQVGHV